MTSSKDLTQKSKPANESFFRLAAMQNPPPVSLDTELMARPLSFKLVSFTLATMAIIAAIYLSSVDFSSTRATTGNSVQAQDGSIQFVVTVLPDTAPLAGIGDRATVRFDAFPSDTFGAVEATIVSIDSIREGASASSRVRLTLKLDQEFLEDLNRKVPLQAGLNGQAQLEIETKSLLAWIIQYLRAGEER